MEGADDDFHLPEYVAAAKADAAALKLQAVEHGLRSEGDLAPGEMEGHPDLRLDLFRQAIPKRMDDPHTGIPAEKAFARLTEKMARESIPCRMG